MYFIVRVWQIALSSEAIGHDDDLIELVNEFDYLGFKLTVDGC